MYMIPYTYFTPLNIINRTPEGRPVQCSRATLPVNQLKGNPPSVDCPISNVHGCIHLRVLLHSFPRIGKNDSETDEST
jgi:hypothetical protein